MPTRSLDLKSTTVNPKRVDPELAASQSDERRQLRTEARASKSGESADRFTSSGLSPPDLETAVSTSRNERRRAARAVARDRKRVLEILSKQPALSSQARQVELLAMRRENDEVVKLAIRMFARRLIDVAVTRSHAISADALLRGEVFHLDFTQEDLRELVLAVLG